MLKKEQKNVNRFKSYQLNLLDKQTDMEQSAKSSWTKRGLYLHKNYEIFIFSTSYAKFSTEIYAGNPQLISERVTNFQSIAISKSIFWTNKQIWSNQVIISRTLMSPHSKFWFPKAKFRFIWIFQRSKQRHKRKGSKYKTGEI